MSGSDNLFEVRAERDDPRSRLWTWAIYRTGALSPARRSRPMYATDADAMEAGTQVIVAMRQRAARSSFGGPGV